MTAINKDALALIKQFEGLRLNAYPDPATNGDPWTIGYGHTSAAGIPNVKKGMKITALTAETILEDDIKAVAAGVRKLVTAPLNENQFGALVSFAFNLGLTNLSTSTLLRKLNAGDYAGAAAEFPRWNRAAGKVMKGLTRRREAEQELFLTPATAAVPDIPVPPPPDIEHYPEPEPTLPRTGEGLPGWMVALIWLVVAVALIGAAFLVRF